MRFDDRTEEFLVQFDSCYFAPSRWRLFPSCKLYRMARNAMLLLWNACEIELFGICYDNDAIRTVIEGEMMPQHLDHAVRRFVQMPQMKSERQLAELIFHCIIFDGIDEAILIARDFPKGGAA